MSFWGSIVLVVLAGLALGGFAATQPKWNIDTIGYAAAAHRLLGASDADVHTRVYADMNASAPAKSRRDISSSSEYRVTIAADPRAFATQIDFYAHKYLYVIAVALAMQPGANSVAATFYVSAAALALLAMVWLVALLRITNAPLAWGVGLCVLLSPPLRELGRLATPDALAVLFMFAGACILLMAERRRWLALVPWLAAIGTRSDSVLFVIALLSWLAWCEPEVRRFALGGAALCVLACAAVSLADPYPWSTLISHAFFDRITDQSLAERGSTVDPVRYLAALARGLRGDFVKHESNSFFFIALSLVVLWGRARKGDAAPDPRLRLHGLIWAAAGLHFLVFPMLADRFFIAHYLTVTWLAVAGLRPTQTEAHRYTFGVNVNS